MPDLFGLDIAAIIDDAMGADLLQGQLRKKARKSGGRPAGSLTAGNAEDFGDPVAFNGFMEERTEENRGGSLTRLEGRVISVLGGSLPDDTTPERGDSLTLEGKTYIIIETMRDPAGAVFECMVEGK